MVGAVLIHVPGMYGLNIRGSLAPNFVWRIVRAHSSTSTKFTAKTASMFSPFMPGTCTLVLVVKGMQRCHFPCVFKEAQQRHKSGS